ncbi:MAG: dTDP-glucose pyrophosphorylase, partial [Gemmatimonadota bacterium]
METRTPCELVGLVPAAGKARRLVSLPCSKEIYPVGFGSRDGDGPRPKVVCEHLLERMRLAGVRKAYVVLRKGKWDIPAYLGDGHQLDMRLAYLMMGAPFGVPYTLDQAYRFLDQATVVFGFPDLLFQPADAFVHLLSRQTMTGADVVLGLFPSDRPSKMDMVERDPEGRVRTIVVKPAHTRLRYAWTIAVWGPAFTRFMHDYLARWQPTRTDTTTVEPELFIGEVIQAAVTDGMAVQSAEFPHGRCVDIGTSEDLLRAVREGV